MISGIYVSAMGMLSTENKHDVIANNLANINTNGFKRQDTAFKALMQEGHRDPERMDLEYEKVITDNIFTDWEQGITTHTGNPLDIAVLNDAFFVVQTPQGEKYTKAGNFSLDIDGALINADGYPVMGAGGPIIINGENINVSNQGEIIVDGVLIDNLRMVEVPDKSMLIREGYTLYSLPEGIQPIDLEQDFVFVKNETLENSNVNPVEEMVNMIRATRQYETNQRSVVTQDRTLDKLLNEVARI